MTQEERERAVIEADKRKAIEAFYEAYAALCRAHKMSIQGCDYIAWIDEDPEDVEGNLEAVRRGSDPHIEEKPPAPE
jgi:hypothetical protein